ncbi:SagB/ThcOx family dehydrogenase [Cellulomonas shaoxiangyii]|uniref:SagB/ThcOx family dehydrogenase n=1 Tax=Cellulomonas shaoxiangyii TaxID=2566013 RepID=A0A4P7SIQ2_9CELL|nr:SagB/ThcOx family dehydrogenase [Cellulomonas shaoxiangyii]QCB93528.1 SagB/ThcOx family dehydrogenase [Cellulomonas shaoxiangyii]TGY86850.1 SagB/ThcOx family dehydrogenase [Cellulomonas shaoxiangyii]
MTSTWPRELGTLDATYHESPAELFHENSKVTRTADGAGLSAPVRHAMAHGRKTYAAGAVTPLPPPARTGGPGVLAVMDGRRSVRAYSSEPVTLASLSTVLHHAYGEHPDRRPFRSVPSGGGLYPLELYVAVLAGTAPTPGIYHYDVQHHALERLPGDRDPDAVRRTVFVPEAAATAPVVLVVTALFGRSRIKYGERGYRFALLEAGHVMQNVVLACAAVGLASCPFGGFVDDEVHDALSVDGVDEACLYLATLGTPVP